MSRSNILFEIVNNASKIGIQKIISTIKLNFKSPRIEYADTIEEALSLGVSYAITSLRSMIFCSAYDIKKAYHILDEISYVGVRGGLVLAYLDKLSYSTDLRPIASALELPLIQPRTFKEILLSLMYTFELSEALEIPVLYSLPLGYYSGSKLILREVRSYSMPPTFSKRWENPYRWIYFEDEYKSNLRVKLNVILKNLFKKFELNEYADNGGDTLIIAFGALSTIPYLIKDSNGKYDYYLISLHVPQAYMEEKVYSVARKYKKIVVLEPGYPIIEEIIRRRIKDSKIYGKMSLPDDLLREFKVEYIAKVLKEAGIMSEQQLSTPEEFELEKIKAYMIKIDENIRQILLFLKRYIEKLNTIPIVVLDYNILQDSNLDVLRYVSMAKADFDFKPKRYKIKNLLDVIDISLKTIDPVSLTASLRRILNGGYTIILVSDINTLEGKISKLGDIDCVIVIARRGVKKDSVEKLKDVGFKVFKVEDLNNIKVHRGKLLIVVEV